MNRLVRNERGKVVYDVNDVAEIENDDPEQTEEWGLDALGNWDTYQLDGDGDELYSSVADLNDDRDHDDDGANELESWDPWPANSVNAPVSAVYDGNGNLTDDGFEYQYTYDAWNQLVKVEDQKATPNVIGLYKYDALGRRYMRIFDTDLDGDAEDNGDDVRQHEYYTAGWRRIEVRPDDSTTDGSVYVFGARRIDDYVLRARDTTSDGVLDETHYYLDDANGNVVMLVTAGARGVERIFYNAYGVPECFPFGDANGDYTVDTADATISGYWLLADVNLDGQVNTTDQTLVQNNYLGATGGWNVLSAAGASSGDINNDVGYGGYLWNDERAQYTVRYREYSPTLGRWL